MPKKILFINQETAPYLPETTEALLGKELPESLQESGYEIRAFMPKWGAINERRGQLHEVIRLSGINLVVGEDDHPLLIKVASLPSRLQVYFIDNEEFFSRNKKDLGQGKDIQDKGIKTIFFTKGVLETVKKLRWAPDVIVCQGWMTALIPLYIRTVYNEEPCFAETKIITTLFDKGFEGEMKEAFFQALIHKDISRDTLKGYKKKFSIKEFERLAKEFSDGVILASDYKKEELINKYKMVIEEMINK